MCSYGARPARGRFRLGADPERFDSVADFPSVLESGVAGPPRKEGNGAQSQLVSFIY